MQLAVGLFCMENAESNKATTAQLKCFATYSANSLFSSSSSSMLLVNNRISSKLDNFLDPYSFCSCYPSKDGFLIPTSKDNFLWASSETFLTPSKEHFL